MNEHNNASVVVSGVVVVAQIVDNLSHFLLVVVPCVPTRVVPVILIL